MQDLWGIMVAVIGDSHVARIIACSEDSCKERMAVASSKRQASRPQLHPVYDTSSCDGLNCVEYRKRIVPKKKSFLLR